MTNAGQDDGFPILSYHVPDIDLKLVESVEVEPIQKFVHFGLERANDNDGNELATLILSVASLAYYYFLFVCQTFTTYL